MTKLNSPSKHAFYNARKRNGDSKEIAEVTGYSNSHVTNVINGNRKVNKDIADYMYIMSRRRIKNSELVK